MSRRRRRGGSRKRWLAVAAAVAVVFAAVPAASYTTASVPRDTGATVVDDPNGVLGLEKFDVSKKQFDTLVNVTNRFGDRAMVKVELTDTGLRNTTLYADIDGDGSYERNGTRVSFWLAPGGTQSVVLYTEENNNAVVGYEVTVEAGGVSGSAARTTTVQNGNGNGGNNCPGNSNKPGCR